MASRGIEKERGKGPRKGIVRLFHQRADEAGPLLHALRDSGYRVIYSAASGVPSVREVQDEGTSAIVIDL